MHIAFNLLLVLAWSLTQRRAVAWLGQGLVASEGTLHLLLAGALLVWMARHLRPAEMLARLNKPASGPALAWVLTGALPLCLALWGPDLRSVHGMVLVLSAYGLVGLFMEPHAWRRLRPLGLLAAAVLPLTGHLDVVLGLPLRTWIAGAVAQLYGSLQTATVLQVDGGFAHVDLPCAGVRSLWSSGVVLSGAALLWRKPVGRAWLGVLALTWALIVLGNGARVALIVGVHHALGMPLLAEILHTPIGVLTFVAAMAPGLVLLHTMGVGAPSPRGFARPTTRGLGPAVLALCAALAMPRAAPVVRASPVPVVPAGWTELVPTDGERRFVEGRGGEIRKARFEVEDASGTVAWITSRSWLTQHAPELCYEAGGWSLTADHPARIGATPVRWAELERGDQRATAVWWFESTTHATDDHTERISAGLRSDAPWLLVSVMVEGRPDPQDPSLASLVRQLRAADRLTFASLASLETP